MRFEERIGLAKFLETHHRMRVQPSPDEGIRLVGHLRFRADGIDLPIIEDEYRVQIDVPPEFPKGLPKVLELDLRIPRHIDHHVYPDGSLCLGSPLRLYFIARKSSDLTEFVRLGITPYLYAASYREKTGGSYPFGELMHGAKGLLHDYAQLFGLSHPKQAGKALILLGMKRRHANKRPCPCGCGRRLGVCRFNSTVRRLRGEFGRSLFRQLYRQVLKN